MTIGTVLPGTGRGTGRRLVEGGGLFHDAGRMRTAPSTMLRMVPLPVPGRI
jgi:hypothetical protein